MIPTSNSSYRTRKADDIPQLRIKHNFFKNWIFPSVILEWNKLVSDIRNLKSLSLFKSRILKFIRPVPNSVFNCHNPKGLKFLTRIRLGLSHLREHKFKHSFQDTLEPICSCGNDIETSAHFLLSCPNFDAERNTLLNNIRKIAPNILNMNTSQLTDILLFGDTSLKNELNADLLNCTIEYVLSTRRFDMSLF